MYIEVTTSIHNTRTLGGLTLHIKHHDQSKTALILHKLKKAFQVKDMLKVTVPPGNYIFSIIAKGNTYTELALDNIHLEAGACKQPSMFINCLKWPKILLIVITIVVFFTDADLRPSEAVSYTESAFQHSCDTIKVCQPVYLPSEKFDDKDDIEEVHLEGEMVITDTQAHKNWAPRKYEVFDSLSHVREDFLLNCTWQGSDVCESSITPTITEMGLCWTFNANRSHPFVIDRPGEQNGVSFWINVESYEQFQNYDDDSGVKVHLHPQDEPPQVGDLGFAVPVGFHCLASVTYTKTHNLATPTASCLDTLVNTTYSRTACEHECHARYIADKCGCYPGYFRLHYMDDDMDNCDFHQTINCVEQLISGGLHDANCTCVDSCHHNVYATKLSYADITGRTLPHMNLTILQNRVNRGIELKHRLQADELEKTLESLHNWSDSSFQLKDELPDSLIPLTKLINTENSFYKNIQRDMKNLLLRASKHIDMYDVFIHPIIHASIAVGETAIRDLQDLQNYIISLGENIEVDTLFLAKAKHVLVDIRTAQFKMNFISNWPNNVKNLQNQTGPMLNTKFWFSDSCKDDFAQGFNNIKSVYNKLVAKNLSEPHELTTAIIPVNNSDTYKTLFGLNSLVFNTIKSWGRLAQCLEQYGSHLKERTVLLDNINGMEKQAMILQYDKSQKDALSSLLFVVPHIMLYMNKFSTKTSMLVNDFSPKRQDKISKSIQGKKY